MTDGMRDVAIIGGGPAGSTCGTLLRKYAPDMDVVILEKERFPRDHVGESQLPGVSGVLAEMGVWDAVEAAGFPIKIGASYTWGRDAESWDFDFFPVERFVDEPRPARYEGQRRQTAFQVDRAIYDDILLRHAESMGCEVREQTLVRRVLRTGDRVDGLELDSGEVVRATHYVDASGAPALLRRAMDVTGWTPAELKNIAVWDYWRNAEWAVEIGVGATRVQVRSLPYGWMWFIPLGPDRTSIGLICPVTYYKESGLSPEELYRRAIGEQAQIAELTRNATPEGPIQTCKDWSNSADRLVGENWFLTGEAAGFADPILAAGMNIAHNAARDLAYTILELERGEHDAGWLRERYDTRHRSNIQQHIRFAQFWYASNGCFTDLKKHCVKIAKEAGLKLTPDEAWRWLSQGGFVSEQPGHAVLGSFDLTSARAIMRRMGRGRGASGILERHNVFELDLAGAREDWLGIPDEGRIKRVRCLRRGDRIAPLVGPVGLVLDVLRRASTLDAIEQGIRRGILALDVPPADHESVFNRAIMALEALASEGWVETRFDASKPKFKTASADFPVRSSEAGMAALEERAAAAGSG